MCPGANLQRELGVQVNFASIISQGEWETHTNKNANMARHSTAIPASHNVPCCFDDTCKLHSMLHSNGQLLDP